MASTPWYSRAAVDRFVLSAPVQNIVIVVILFNAVLLGLETVPQVMDTAGEALHMLDKACLAIFVVEIALKLYSQRLRFFANAWNVFDFIVVAVALIPGADALAVLRAMRVLRVLRLISAIPALRKVVDALVRAVPGIASIAALLGIVFYVGAVMATMLFGAKFPAEFGGLGPSLFSLFQIMTLDGWSDLARTVTEEVSWAPAFFVPFVLISALTVLNLFIAVIVDAMQGLNEEEKAAPEEAQPAEGEGRSGEILSEISALRAEVAALTSALSRRS